MNRSQYRNIPLMLLAAMALLAGIWAGLERLGLSFSSVRFILPGQHGALMIPGFLATLISLERVVALNQGLIYQQQSKDQSTRAGRVRPEIFYLAPLFSAFGVVLLLINVPTSWSISAFWLGAVGFVLVNIQLVRKFFDMATITLLTAAVLYWIGSSLWLLGKPIPTPVPWWIAFLILTVAGERVELAHIIQRKSGARKYFILILVVLLTGLGISLIRVGLGLQITGLGYLSLGMWLFSNDIARRTIRSTHLTRYIAACLLPGFFWLLVGGSLWMYYGGGYTAGYVYDALLHTLLVGFVFSMIFGHGPVILPAITGRPLGYRAFFYLPLVLLHLSLILRLAGDVLLEPDLRTWGAVGNGLAILLFLVSMILAMVQSTGSKKGPAQQKKVPSPSSFPDRTGL